MHRLEKTLLKIVNLHPKTGFLLTIGFILYLFNFNSKFNKDFGLFFFSNCVRQKSFPLRCLI